MAKIMVNVQKRLKGASAEADFWHGEYIDLAEKNGDFQWGPLQSEIEVVKSENWIFSQFLLKEFEKNSMN